MNGVNWFTLIIMLVLMEDFACAEEKWIADEIFTQMSEMRKEIQQLKDKVAGLEQKQQAQQPKATPIAIKGSEKMSLGKKEATIGIVEFSDYECPYCAKHYKNVLPKLREQYIDKGRVKYVMKDYPLEFHAHAKKASLAARCAGEQGQYWEMHNAIFDGQGIASDELINKIADQNKMNLTALHKCLDDPAQLANIEADIALGNKLGVNGTPAFLVGIVKDNQLINYQKLSGVQSFESFAGIIDSLQKR